MTLVDLIDEHFDAFVYDWRTRFGASFEDVLDGTFGWGEAISLASKLTRDPTSHVGSANSKMKHPWSYEAFILADLFDVTLAGLWSDKSGKRTAYPRPSDLDEPTAGHMGDTSKITQDEVYALLASRGHGPQPATPSGKPRDTLGRFCKV